MTSFDIGDARDMVDNWEWQKDSTGEWWSFPVGRNSRGFIWLNREQTDAIWRENGSHRAKGRKVAEGQMGPYIDWSLEIMPNGAGQLWFFEYSR
jgi:hypothetical protein